LDDTPDLVSQEHDDDSTAESDDDTSSCSSVASDDDSFVADDLEDYLTPIVAKPEIDTPQPQLPMLRRGTRIRKPNPRYASTYTSTVCWETLCEDKELQEACAAEAHATPMPPTQNAMSWEPAPKTLREILKKAQWSRENRLATVSVQGIQDTH
jgi:hypothetical protein